MFWSLGILGGEGGGGFGEIFGENEFILMLLGRGGRGEGNNGSGLLEACSANGNGYIVEREGYIRQVGQF